MAFVISMPILRGKSPESRVQSPESRVQGPVQLLEKLLLCKLTVGAVEY